MLYLKLLRIDQYAKNLFIFLPMFFGLRITEVDLLIKTAIAFIGFSLVASSIYIYNDYRDLSDDRNHPIKKHRPLASGKVTLKKAFIVMALLAIIGSITLAYINYIVFALGVLYILINILYSVKLKQVAILDVFIIAFGFTIRIFIGGQSTGIELQPWIVVMTFLLALFMGLGKRRDDYNLTKLLGKEIRKSMTGYSAKLLDYSMVVMASVIIVSYLMYTLSLDIETKFHTNDLYYTSIFVLMGVLRYMQIIFVEKSGGAPTDIFWKDRIIQLSLLGWITLFGVIIYL